MHRRLALVWVLIILSCFTLSCLTPPPYCTHFGIVYIALSDQPGALELQKVLINLLVDFGVMAAAALCYNFET